MAVAVAGVKRSHYDMTGAAHERRGSDSVTTSRAQSRLGTPTPTWSVTPENGWDQIASNLPQRTAFEPFASVVLIGVRGVGKSTLGVLAATAYNRRLVDTERSFLEKTGSTTASYRKLKGIAEYRRRHKEVLQDTLKANDTGAVIICSFSDLEGDGRKLVQEYSQSHPVIHISRDTEGIQSYLQVWTRERINELLSASNKLLRQCSNYEFFNLSERESRIESQVTPNGSITGSPAASTSNGGFLTLKRVERDFIRLLRNVIGDHERHPVHHSAYPFSHVEVESRPYTFAVALSVSDLLSGSIDLDEVQIGADCIEIVLDGHVSVGRAAFSDISLAFAVVRRATVLPILLTIENSNAPNRLSQAGMFEMTNYCLRLGPELCTIDLNLDNSQLGQLIGCKGSSTVIGLSQKNKRPPQGWNDQSLIDTYTRAAKLGCDVVKITIPAQSFDEVLAISAFQNAIGALSMMPKLIAYSTGRKGMSSRCLNKVLTSVVAPASLVAKDEPAAGPALSAKLITEALFAGFIFQPMRFFLCGSDVSYSLSPAMHNAAYQACGMRYQYEAHSTDNLDDVADLMRADDVGGMAVAQPFKTIAVAMMDGLSPHAKAIRAVNTIIPVRELCLDGSIPDELSIIAQRNRLGPLKALYGFNTDWIGIRACIRRGLSPANTIRPQSSGLVCGAGGMARSAIYALISLGVRNILVCNRTSSKATELAEHYNGLIGNGNLPELIPEGATSTRVQVVESFASTWPSDVRQPTVVVCCIPRQAAGEPPTNFSLPEAWLKSPTGGVVVEVGYGLQTSPVAHQVRDRSEKGWIFLDGLSVLPEQAFAQFELFTGRRAPRKLMKDVISKHSPSNDSSGGDIG